MNVRQEFFVTVQCALAYTFRIGSLFVRNIIGTIGRPAVSDGHTRKRRKKPSVPLQQAECKSSGLGNSEV